MTEDLTRILERFLADSTVLIRVDGHPVGTGFFVSRRGLICSCHHLFDPLTNATVEAEWRGRPYPLLYLKEKSSPRMDLQILRIHPDALGEQITPPLPLMDLTAAPEYRFGEAVTLGFAGLMTAGAPVALRLYEGRLIRLALWPGGGVKRTELEMLDLVIGKGNSGAPIFDPRLFRVVAYVAGRADVVGDVPAMDPKAEKASRVDRLGRGLLLSQLIRDNPEWAAEWREAAEHADAFKREAFRILGTGIPTTYLTAADVQAAAATHNRASIGALAHAGVYQETLFVARDAGRKLEAFLSDTGHPAAIVTGTSGTGKTNLLIDAVRRHEGADTLGLFVSCRSLGAADLMSALPGLLGVAAPLGETMHFLAGCGLRRVLLVFDGFNEWADASGAQLRRMIEDIREAAGDFGRTIKIVVGCRTEFLREAAPDLLSRAEGGNESAARDFLFHDTDGGETSRPVIEIPNLWLGEDHDSPEQEAIYEHYRSCRTLRDASGRPVGICPKTRYRELTPAVRRILDRPLLLKLFVMRFDGEHVPDTVLPSACLERMIPPEFQSLAGHAIDRESVESFLADFAFHLFQLDVSSCALSRLLGESWWDEEILETLLAHTFLLSRDRVAEGDEAGDLAFASDWLLEHYLGLRVWQEARLISDAERTALIERLLRKRSRNAGTLVGALTCFGERAVHEDLPMLDVLLHAISGRDEPAKRAALLRGFFEFIRTHYAYQKPIGAGGHSFAQLLLAKNAQVAPAGMQRILRYLEQLGDDATGDALYLLDFDAHFWDRLPGQLKIEWVSIRGLKRFKADGVEKAIAELEPIDETTVSRRTWARTVFTLGRCYQYRGEYARAAATFRKCVDVPDSYGAMCRHQLAFIQFFYESDYRAAAEMLAPATEGESANSASRLLYATCLAELGRFGEAETMLREDIETRRRRRLRLAAGKAMRTLAQMEMYRFEGSRAQQLLQAAKELALDNPHGLTLAGVLDLEAHVAGVLGVDPALAMASVEEAIRLSESGNHPASISWSLQTRALLHALAGDIANVEADLGRLASFRCNPNQVRRSTMIRLLGRRRAGIADESDRDAARDLAAGYQTAGNIWYIGLAALLRAALDGEFPSSSEAAAALFPAPVNAQKLGQSRIFEALRQIAQAV